MCIYPIIEYSECDFDSAACGAGQKQKAVSVLIV